MKAVPRSDLERLASEIRTRIIETVARTGGHLAPNLGVVELTIALHRVFSSPRDRIVWDVGHQTYTHKLLTGRRLAFDTLRQEGGLSGFPRRAESAHDVFEAGHASTSISAALGMARARDMRGASYEVVAVIGDGALTGGMAFEALNNAGHMKTKIIVVLNDNELSYGPTVGGLAAYLARTRTHPAYMRFRHGLERFVKGVPLIGPALFGLGGRLKGGLKYLLLMRGMLFEELGFTYLGPIDGHSFAQLEDYLNRAKRIKGPVFVHVLTKKGKGYAPAEADPDRFHGTGPFVVATGEPVVPGTKRPSSGPSTSMNGSHAGEDAATPAGGADAAGAAGGRTAPPTYTQAFGETLVRLGAEDERIVAITAAMASSTGVSPFARRFPNRWFDVGICEQHAVTFAAGLAREGYRPVVAIYSTFLQRAYDQVLHDVCLQRLPVTFALDRAGLVGADGPTHQGVYDIAYLRSMPGMVVMAPRDENELQHMLKTALSWEGPVAIRYPRGAGPGATLDPRPRLLKMGEAEVLEEGDDVALVALGTMAEPAVEAGRILRERGIRAAVVNARFAAPLDRDFYVNLGRRVGAIVTVEEHVLSGGFGSAVAELLSDAAGGGAENGEAAGRGTGGLAGPDGRGHGVLLRRLALPNEPVLHGGVDKLLARFGLDAAGIVRAAEELAARKTAK